LNKGQSTDTRFLKIYLFLIKLPRSGYFISQTYGIEAQENAAELPVHNLINVAAYSTGV
jgi:hypothetical protein